MAEYVAYGAIAVNLAVTWWLVKQVNRLHERVHGRHTAKRARWTLHIVGHGYQWLELCTGKYRCCPEGESHLTCRPVHAWYWKRLRIPKFIMHHFLGKVVFGYHLTWHDIVWHQLDAAPQKGD